MSLKKLSQLNIIKSGVLFVLLISSFFLGNTKVEAGAVSWGVVNEVCFGYDTTARTGGWVYTDWGDQYVTYPEPLFSTSFGDATLTQLSAYFQEYPIIKPGTLYYYEIMTSDGPVTSYFPNSACKGVESTHYFAANTSKQIDEYAPGETITASLGANSSGGYTQGGWSGFTTSLLWNPITGPISCFLFGCDSPPYVRVLASVQGQYIADCHGDGTAGCSGTINTPSVPLAPGSYNLHLEGCYINCSPVGTADIPFVVTTPAVPTVQLNFSFLDKIKSSLGII